MKENGHGGVEWGPLPTRNWGKSGWRDRHGWLVWALVLLLSTRGLSGQDAPGEGHAPTMRVGNTEIDVKGSFEVEFNDNINYSHSDRVFDIILRPGVTVGVTDRLNENNSVNLQMGVAWEEYLLHPGESSYTNFAAVSPDSKLAYTIKAPPFTFSIYDSFNYSVQPSDTVDFNPATGKVLTNLKAFGRFSNQLGVTGELEMNKVTLKAGLYRYDVFPQEALLSFLRRWQYTATAGLSYAYSESLTAELNASYTYNYYREHLENDSHSWYLGASLNGQISKTITLDASVGFTNFSFQQNGSNGDNSQPQGITGSLSLTQKISERKTHTLTLTREMSFGYVSNEVTVDRVSYKFQLQNFIFEKMVGTFSAYWEHGRDSGGLAPEDYQKYVISPSISYALTKRSEWYASYEFTDKFSNFGDRSYYRNQIILGFRYEF